MQAADSAPPPEIERVGVRLFEPQLADDPPQPMSNLMLVGAVTATEYLFTQGAEVLLRVAHLLPPALLLTHIPTTVPPF